MVDMRTGNSSKIHLLKNRISARLESVDISEKTHLKSNHKGGQHPSKKQAKKKHQNEPHQLYSCGFWTPRGKRKGIKDMSQKRKQRK